MPRKPLRILPAAARIPALVAATAGNSQAVRYAVDGGRNLSLFVRNGHASWLLNYHTAAGWNSRGLGSFPGVSLTEAKNRADAARVKLRTGTAPGPGAVGTAPRLHEGEAVEMPRPIRPAFAHAPRASRASRTARLTDRTPQADCGTPEPVSGPLRAPARRGQNAFAPWRAIPALMAKLAAEPSEIARAYQIAILTGARIGEVVRGGTKGSPGMMWEEIDLGSKIWSVPGLESKDGRCMKSGYAHHVPLSDEMIALLGAPGKGEVFPGLRRGRINTLLARSDFVEAFGEITPHGARSSFKSWARAQTVVISGIPTRVYSDNDISEAIGHLVENKVERSYGAGDWDTVEMRRHLMKAWSKFATSGGDPSLTRFGLTLTSRTMQ